jgi:hypothetical protein
MPVALNPSTDRLVVEVRRHGDTLLSEEIHFLSPASGPIEDRPLVPLLTTSSELRRQLVLEAPEPPVEVILHLNGAFLVSWDLADLIAGPGTLGDAETRVATVAARPVSPPKPQDGLTAVAAALSPCVRSCKGLREDCEIFRCEKDISTPPPGCLDACQEEYEECLEFECGICTPTSTVIGPTYTKLSDIETQLFDCGVKNGKGWVVNPRDRLWKVTVTTTTKSSSCVVTTDTKQCTFADRCWVNVELEPFCEFLPAHALVLGPWCSDLDGGPDPNAAGCTPQ